VVINMSDKKQTCQLISILTDINEKLTGMEKSLKKLVRYQQKPIKNKACRRSGNGLSKIQLNGLEDDVDKLIFQGKTYVEIIDIIKKKTGCHLSKSAISRYYQTKHASNK
jgi:hypothetical protein